MMKRIAALLICVTLLLCLTSCGDDGKSKLTKINNNKVDIDAIAQQNEEQSGTVEEPQDVQTAEQPNITAEVSEAQITSVPEYDGTIDVDLTRMSATMVYSEVLNMMTYPEEYVGKVVRAEGMFNDYTDPASGNLYYSVVVADATACCQQGLEFVWNGEHSYPDDYPQYGETVSVTGEFEIYEEDGLSYCHLVCDDVYALGFGA